MSDWFDRRTFRHDRYSDLSALVALKQQRGLSLSVVLPAKECASTIGPIVECVQSANESGPLVDQLMVVDAGSGDGTAELARQAGAEVFDESELLSDFGPAVGKGDAMWRALSVAKGDLVAFLDSDTTDFGRHFVTGMLGPMLEEPSLEFLKAAYSRPFKAPDGTVIDDAGRVTELTAKPLFNAFFPELCGFGQPLSGEVIASRDLLCSIPFCTGYAVETAMMIDVLRRVGIDAMGQVDLGTRQNRYQSLFDLGAMAYAVVRAVMMRSATGQAATHLPDPDRYLHAICPEGGPQLEERLVKILERPPISTLPSLS